MAMAIQRIGVGLGMVNEDVLWPPVGYMPVMHALHPSHMCPMGRREGCVMASCLTLTLTLTLTQTQALTLTLTLTLTQTVTVTHTLKP